MFMMKYAVLFFLVWVQYFCSGCTSGPTGPELTVSPKTNAALSPEYLALNERIILDWYKGDSERKNALELLKDRCEDILIKDALSCYNAAVLLRKQKLDEDAFRFAEKAVKHSPDDAEYQGLFYSLASRLGKVNDISAKFPETGGAELFAEVENLCKSNDRIKLLAVLDEISSKGLFSSNSFTTGLLGDCLSNEEKALYIKKNSPNKADFASLYYKEKAKVHPFSQFWDTEYYVQKKKLEDSKADFKSPLTREWAAFRKSVRENNMKGAEANLRSFLSLLKTEREKKKTDRSYQAVYRAAYVLVEQDEFFKNVRYLLKEFPDTL